MNPGTTLRASGVHAWQFGKRHFWLIRERGPYTNFWMPDAERVLDIAVDGERITVLCEDNRGRFVVETTMTANAFEPRRDVSWDATRIAMTATTTFVAGDAEVVALRQVEDARSVRPQMADEIVVPDPIDVAASSDALAVLGDRGLTLFDADGRNARRVDVQGIALARDGVRPGWIVATGDAAIVHVDPTGNVRPLARTACAANIKRIARSKDAIYVDTGARLFEVTIDGAETELPYETVWDADASGIFVESGGSFDSYFGGGDCTCGGRRRRRYSTTHYTSDGNGYSVYAVTCIRCNRTTSEEDNPY